MVEKQYQVIVVVMVVAGGSFIAFVIWAFIIFSRFLEREKQAGERFRAEVAARRAEEAKHKEVP